MGRCIPFRRTSTAERKRPGQSLPDQDQLQNLSENNAVVPVALSHNHCNCPACDSLLTALIMGGTGDGEFVCAIAGTEFNAVQATGLIILQMILISLYAILINSIASLMSRWISNKYILQSAALVFFSIIPLLASSILTEYSSDLLPQIIMMFLPWEMLRVLEWTFQDSIPLINYTVPVIVFFLLAVILYHANVQKYAKDYI